MSEYSYGVVVEKYDDRFGIWLLFRDAVSCLTALDTGLCADPLRVGDIVQAKSDGDQSSIRQAWAFADSIWSDRDRVVVRSIVSFDREITVDRGRWKDNATGLPSVLLVSRDIGIISVPVNWYNRELFEANVYHLLVYAQFLPRTLTNRDSGENIEVFWSIIDNRISIPAVPSTHVVSDKFLEWDQLRKVPVLTIGRQGNSLLTWSYALGDHMIVVKDGGSLGIGHWLMARVTRSSPGDFKIHGCAYTALTAFPVVPHSQPEVKVDRGKISMVLTLNRSESDPSNPDAEVTLTTEYGLPVSSDNKNKEWIRGESKEFKTTVEVVMGPFDLSDGRRVQLNISRPIEMRDGGGAQKEVRETGKKRNFSIEVPYQFPNSGKDETSSGAFDMSSLSSTMLNTPSPTFGEYSDPISGFGCMSIAPNVNSGFGAAGTVFKGFGEKGGDFKGFGEFKKFEGNGEELKGNAGDFKGFGEFKKIEGNGEELKGNAGEFKGFGEFKKIEGNGGGFKGFGEKGGEFKGFGGTQGNQGDFHRKKKKDGFGPSRGFN